MTVGRWLRSFAFTMLILFWALFSPFFSVNAESTDRNPVLSASDSHQNTFYAFRAYDGVWYLYLPGYMKSDTVQVICKQTHKKTDGHISEIDTILTVPVTAEGLLFDDGYGQNQQLYVMFSDLPCVVLQLHDTTLDEINSHSKHIKYPGNQLLLDPGSGEQVTLHEAVIKGRGNFSWSFLPKKSYQIKLSEKASVFGLKSAKTWVLLANYTDDSLVRNKAALELAISMGFPHAVQCRYTDLWIDGEYLGNYLLTEKIQINPNRIALQNSDAILVELDNIYYQEESDPGAVSFAGNHFVPKDYPTDSEILNQQSFDRFMNRINAFEQALSIHAEWKQVISHVDLDSFVRMYFLLELTENSDGCRSSLFFYQDGDDVIHLGPPWDFDIAFGDYVVDWRGGYPSIDYIPQIRSWFDDATEMFAQLLTYPEFRTVMVEYYQETLQPILKTLDDSLLGYAEEISVSREMNRMKWNGPEKDTFFKAHVVYSIYEQELDHVRDWVRERIAYMNQRYVPAFAELYQPSP